MTAILIGSVVLSTCLIHWFVSPRWQNFVLLCGSLSIGIIFWPVTVAVVLALALLQHYLADRLPFWIVISILLLPLVIQKLWETSVLGLSYGSLMALGLYLDTRRGLVTGPSLEQRIGFATLFPVIPVGPIERWGNLRQAFNSERKFRSEMLLSGLLLITFGLFKKIVIADRLSELAVDPNQNFLHYSSVSLWAYFGLSLLQIYCEFSGIIHIARGVSRLFGIEIMENFDRPYLAESIQDIWKRWHISLVSWLRDHVYTPIALRTRSVVLASSAVLLLVGLWHGLRWQMVAWSLYWVIPFWIAVALRERGIRPNLPVFLNRLICIVIMAYSTVFLSPKTWGDLVTAVERSLFLSQPQTAQLRTLTISDFDLAVSLFGFLVVLLFESQMSRIGITYSKPEIATVTTRVKLATAVFAIFFVYLTIAFGVSGWQSFVYMRY